MEVKINISLKQGVLDPQGRAIENALNGLGYSEASNVRIGKQITLEIEAEDANRAQQRAARMCETLLANTGYRRLHNRGFRPIMRVAILVFPGSNCDRDMMVAVEAITGRRPPGLAQRQPNRSC